MEGAGHDNPQNDDVLKMEHVLSDIDEAAKLYEPLVYDMEQPFQLSHLYEISEQNDLPHVHLTIKMLREAGILVPAGDGAFTWSK